jgi:hypothetical protein
MAQPVDALANCRANVISLSAFRQSRQRLLTRQTIFQHNARHTDLLQPLPGEHEDCDNLSTRGESPESDFARFLQSCGTWYRMMRAG